MLKKSIILFCCTILFLTGCCWDPYADQRPADYGEATWVCQTDDFELWFRIDYSQQDYYIPEGELCKNEETYFCKFYFIQQTDQLLISVYPLKYKDYPDENRKRSAVLFEIIGTCKFSAESFEFYLDQSRSTGFDVGLEKLTFVRIAPETDPETPETE